MPEGITFVDIDADTGKLADAVLPEGDQRVVHRRHRADADLRAASTDVAELDVLPVATDLRRLSRPSYNRHR